MERKKKRTVPLLWTVVLCVVCALAGVAGAFGLFHKLLGQDGLTLLQANYLIESGFVGEYDRDEYLDTVLDTMVEGLGDRWSYYLNAEEYQQTLETRGNAYVGIGITVSPEVEDGLYILSVTPGSGAEEAGLLPGETVRKVDGVAVTPDTRQDCIDSIRGEEGTAVTLEVEDAQGELRTLEVVRATVHSVSAQWSMLEGKVGYLILSNFYSGTAEQAKQGLEELTQEGAKALVVDVRFNPGGYVTELTEILDAILPEGEIFRSEDYDGQEMVYHSGPECLDLPLAVLVNADSYSAAEFLAAQLQESGGAVVVGVQTCGKGFSQRLLPLAGGGALNLSTARYFTGGGRSLIGTGLEPDVPVDMDEEEQTRLYLGQLPPEEDPQLQAALAALGSEK